MHLDVNLLWSAQTTTTTKLKSIFGVGLCKPLFYFCGQVTYLWFICSCGQPGRNSLPCGGQHPKSRIAVNSACFAGPLAKSREKNCCSTGTHHIDCKVY